MVVSQASSGIASQLPGVGGGGKISGKLAPMTNSVLASMHTEMLSPWPMTSSSTRYTNWVCVAPFGVYENAKSSMANSPVLYASGPKPPSPASPLNAHQGCDPKARLKLTDVHLDFVGGLIQHHLGQQQVISTARLRQVFPTDDESPTRELALCLRPNLTTTVADVSVRSHDGVGGQACRTQILIGVIKRPGQVGIERQKSFAADFQTEEIGIEKTKAKREANVGGISRSCHILDQASS